MSSAAPSDKKTVLVTGGNGYIGSHVMICCLLTQKYRVCTIDNFHNSFPEAANRVSQIAKNELGPNATETDVKVFKGDITRKADIEQVFDYYKPAGGVWGVIHVAAHKAVGESGEKPIQYYENNITATINLLEVMERYGTHNIVYSSSATVYGAPSKIPIPEVSPLSPESVYGRTKMFSELIIKDVCDSKPDTWRAIGLRYFNPAGAHPSGLIGEDPRGRPGNLLPLLAHIAVGKIENDLKVFGNDYPTPDGACVRDYIHVMDLAEGHINALDALQRDETFRVVADNAGKGFGGSGGKYRAFNLGRGKGYSVFEMIDAMKKATGFEYKYTVVGRRLGDVPDLTADPALAQKEIGFNATRTLEEMTRDLWNWQSKHPKGLAPDA